MSKISLIVLLVVGLVLLANVAFAACPKVDLNQKTVCSCCCCNCCK